MAVSETLTEVENGKDRIFRTFFYRNLMRQGALTCMKIRSRSPADGEAMV